MAGKFRGLKVEVEHAVLAAIDVEGLQFDRAALVDRFAACGASRRSVQRWIADMMASGQPAQRFHATIAASAQTRAVTQANPAAAAAAEVVAMMPQRLPVDAVLGRGAGAAARYIEQCIDGALQVIAHAQHPDGSVRSAQQMLAGSALLRRSIQTAVRLTERAHALDQIEAFQTAVMNVLARQSPEIAEALLVELRQLATRRDG